MEVHHVPGIDGRGGGSPPWQNSRVGELLCFAQASTTSVLDGFTTMLLEEKLSKVRDSPKLQNQQQVNLRPEPIHSTADS